MLLATLVFSGPVAFAEPAPKTPAAVASAYPTDLKPGHWAYDAARRLAARGVLKGLPDGTFRGTAPVNRFQLAIAIDQAISQLETRIDRLQSSVPAAGDKQARAKPRSARAATLPTAGLADATHATSIIDDDDELDPVNDATDILAASERHGPLGSADARALADLTREFSRELMSLRHRTAGLEERAKTQRRETDILRARVEDLGARIRRDENFRFQSGELRLVGFNIPELRSFTNLILNFGYKIGDRVTGVFSPQLTNTFDGQLFDKLDVWEAYADFNDFGLLHQARVGRQLLLVGGGLTLYDRVEAFNFSTTYADVFMQVLLLGDVMFLAETRNFADQAYGFYYIEQSPNGLNERPLHLGAYVRGKIGSKLYVAAEYANFSNRIATPLNNNTYTQGYLGDVIWEPSPSFRWRESIIAAEEDFRAVSIDRDLAYHSSVSSPLEDVLQTMSQATRQDPIPVGRNELNGFWDLKSSITFDIPRSLFRIGFDWDRVRDYSVRFDNARNGFDVLGLRLRRSMTPTTWLEFRARKLAFEHPDAFAAEGTLDIPRVDRSDVRVQWFGRF